MPKSKTPKPPKINVNRKGFHTANNTQDMSKGTPRERSQTQTIMDTPSGENSLPDVH